MNNSIIKGSISDIATTKGKTLALMQAKKVVICDRSSSMTCVVFGQRARYELEDDILVRLQNKYPGQLVLIAFSDYAEICLDGNLPPPDMTTNMTDGLMKAKDLADLGMDTILISDGEPNMPSETLAFAKTFGHPIETIFVGDEGPEGDGGREFLLQLAKVSRGKFNKASLDKPFLLEETLTKFLLASGN